MGISCAPDIFQDKMSKLMTHLICSRVHKDDLLVLTNGSPEDHLSRLGKVLEPTKGRTEVKFREIQILYRQGGKLNPPQGKEVFNLYSQRLQPSYLKMSPKHQRN